MSPPLAPARSKGQAGTPAPLSAARPKPGRAEGRPLATRFEDLLPREAQGREAAHGRARTTAPAAPEGGEHTAGDARRGRLARLGGRRASPAPASSPPAKGRRSAMSPPLAPARAKGQAGTPTPLSAARPRPGRAEGRPLAPRFEDLFPPPAGV